MKKAIVLMFILVIGSSCIYSQEDHAYFNRALKEKYRLNNKENNFRAYIDYSYKFTDNKNDDTVRHYKIVNIDTSGNISRIADFDESRKLMSLSKFFYNENNENAVRFYIEEGQLKYKTNYYYDLNNELIESIVTTEFGSVHSKTLYYYSGSKKMIGYKTVGPSGNLLFKGKPRYNENDLPTECKTYTGGNLISTHVFKYENDLITEERHTENDADNQTVFQYFYKTGLIDSVFVNDNNKKSFFKRKYLVFGQVRRNIEKWVKIPDFSKYYKFDDNLVQKFEFETPPVFPGGKQALISYIDEHLKFPKKALKAGKEGLVIVNFVIDSSGSTGNIRVSKSIDYELDNAAIDLVKKMPKWEPALNSNGKETMSSFVLPVNFVIN